MKFSTKIKILKIKLTGYLRMKKKIGDENELLRQILKSPPISPVFFTSIIYLSTHLPPKKIYNRVLI